MKSLYKSIVIIALFSLTKGLAQTADLSITQTSDVSRAVVGQNVVYTLSANNVGPDANSQIAVSDYLPAQVSVLNIDPACAIDFTDSRLINCSISLAANSAQNLDITVKVDSLPPAGPRVYLSGLSNDGVSTGFFRQWVDTQQFDVIVAASNLQLNPRGVFLQDDGGVLIAESKDLTLLNPNPVIDGQIHYAHPLENLQQTLATGGFLVNPNDVIKAPDGMLYVADLNGFRYDGNGQVTADTSGRIIKIDPSTGVQSIVSEGTNLTSPTGLIWSSGQLIVTDLSAKIIRIDPSTGTQLVLSQAGLLQTPQSLTQVNGVLYVVDSTAGVIAIDTTTLLQTLFADVQSNGGLLSSPVDIDNFNGQELYVLNGSVANGSNKVISRFDIATGTALADVSMALNMNAVNGFDVDNGGSFLINNATISSAGTVVDNNFLNDTKAISTPVDAAPSAIQLLIQENITVADLVNVNPAMQVLIQENITVADLVSVNPTLKVLIQENITVSDTVIVTPPLQVLIQENITVADLVSVNPALNVLIQENITVADLVNINPALGLLITENITVSDNPNVLILQPPRIVKVRPISGLCQNQLASDDQLPAAVTELEISFSVDMADPAGDTSAVDVSNPLNYRLVSTTDASVVLPNNCADPLPANSTDHNIGIRFYDAVTNTVVLSSPLNTGLPNQRYQLMACYDGLASDTGNLQLDGNADGAAGDDYAVRFSVKTNNKLKNPNFSDGINNWLTSGNVNLLSDDADNALKAGSANIDLAASISQCIELNGESDLRFGTSLKSELATGTSTILINYYDAAQCTGNLLSTKQNQNGANNAVWKNKFLDSTVPSAAVSVLVTVESDANQSPIMLDRSYLIKTSNTIFINGFEDDENNNPCNQFININPSG